MDRGVPTDERRRRGRRRGPGSGRRCCGAGRTRTDGRLPGRGTEHGRAGSVLPLICDADGDFARNYDASDTYVFVICPDGYAGIAARGVVDTDELVRHLKATFR